MLQVIRNDAQLPSNWEAARLHLANPVVRSRIEGAQMMKARWELEKMRQKTEF